MTTVLISLAGELLDISSSIWRVSVGHYHEMIQKGALTISDRLELLDGLLN